MPIEYPSLPLAQISYDSHTFTDAVYLCAAGDVGGTSRVFYNVIDACNQVRFLFGNFYSGSAGELGTLPSNPSTLTIAASIEDPLNPGTVLYQLTFNGNSTATVALNGLVYSDPIDYDFTAGMTIWCRTYVVAQGGAGSYIPLPTVLNSQNGSPTGLGYNNADSTPPGNNYIQNTGAGTNQLATAGTSWLGSGFGAQYFSKNYAPIAALGQRVSGLAPKPVWALMGDSIAWGLGDTNAGELSGYSRAFRANKIPFLNLAASSEAMTAASIPAQFRNRKHLTQFCTHALVAYGANDIFTNGSSYATLVANAQIVYQWLVNRGIKVYAATVMPNSSSSDGFVTAGNQTPSPYDSVRLAWNARLRAWPNPSDALLSLLSGVYDPAAAVEVNALNQFDKAGGRWYCGPQNNTVYCGDGLHPGTLGNILFENALIGPNGVQTIGYPARAARDRFGDT